MPGEANLDTLLKSMDPQIQDGEYVFCTFDHTTYHNLSIDPLLTFHEIEGVTVVIKRKDADKLDLHYGHIWTWITCNVQSDLSAVGFLAAISTELAAAGISINAVSAFNHDHLFVQTHDSERAINLLKELSSKGGKQ